MLRGVEIEKFRSPLDAKRRRISGAVPRGCLYGLYPSHPSFGRQFHLRPWVIGSQLMIPDVQPTTVLFVAAKPVKSRSTLNAHHIATFTHCTPCSAAVGLNLSIPDPASFVGQLAVWKFNSTTSPPPESGCHRERNSVELIYTVSNKNWTIFLFEHNFRKYCPILIILSLLQTEINCPQTRNWIFHFTCSLLLHYLEKCNHIHFTETVE